MPDPNKKPAKQPEQPEQTERETTPLGAWVKRCRKSRGWSRAEFVTQAHELLFALNPALARQIKENWIRNIEEGGRKYITHQTIAVLCLIFEASDDEKRDLLIATGLNPMADDNGQADELQQAFTRLLTFLFKTSVAKIAISGVLNGKITNWPDFFDILKEAVELSQMSDTPDALRNIASSSLPKRLDQHPDQPEQ